MIGDDCDLRGPSPDGARDLAVDPLSGAQAQAPKGLGAAGGSFIGKQSL